MNIKFFEFQDFKKADFTGVLPQKAEYDHCNFSNCNFYESDISNQLGTMHEHGFQ
jgi:hypothetical protein